MLKQFADDKIDDAYDICVVGAGPLGIAVALHCARVGYSVLLIEAGNSLVGAKPELPTSDDRITNEHHSPPELTKARGIGGTSQIWGGRCLPFVDLDFERRPFGGEAQWPIAHADLAPYYARAASFLGIGGCEFSHPLPYAVPSSDFEYDSLEIWVAQPNIGARYRAKLEESASLTLLSGATVTELEISERYGSVSWLVLEDGKRKRKITASRIVLACGGIETTRLLLAAQTRHPSLFGGVNGPLGRFYMGHLTGVIAHIVLSDPKAIRDFDFFKTTGAFARRRLTLSAQAQAQHRLGNIAFWLQNPPIADPVHRNGFLSLLWLLLRIPWIGKNLLPAPYRSKLLGPLPWKHWPHIFNVLRSPLPAILHACRAAQERYFGDIRKPAYLRRNRAGRYALCYHSEHAPHMRSRVSLSDREDALGRPSLDLTLRFDSDDALSVVNSHAILDRALRQAGIGHLEYIEGKQQLLDSVLRQAKDGIHQIGTTRMGVDPATSVVDPDCRVHGLDNLYIASTSVFVTSGTANPTFPGVALALRVADRVLKSLVQPVAAPRKWG